MEPKLRIVSSTRGHLPVVQVIRLKTGAFQNGADRPFRIQLQLRSSKNGGDFGGAADTGGSCRFEPNPLQRARTYSLASQ